MNVVWNKKNVVYVNEDFVEFDLEKIPWVQIMENIENGHTKRFIDWFVKIQYLIHWNNC